ncbi:MAG: hypothetical protein IJY44_08060 [Bacteroidaceae bacterium]|nr:hypothetical protein [Bacteroidaceae bacterium]
MIDNENKTVRDDDAQKRIIERLGERGSKMEKMQRWERASRKSRISLYTAISVAASLLLLVVINPFASRPANAIEELGIMQPAFSVHRGSAEGVAQVEDFIDAGEYYKALDLVEDMLKSSERSIKRAEKVALYDDEEWLYEYKSEKLFNSELRWTYIYLLIVLECESTAVKHLKRYIGDTEFCEHQAEAEKLLKALT